MGKLRRNPTIREILKDSQFNSIVAVSESDTTNQVGWPFFGLYIGVSGNVVIVSENDETVLFKNVVQGSILPIIFKRINATNTSATNMVALKRVD